MFFAKIRGTGATAAGGWSRANDIQEGEMSLEFWLLLPPSARGSSVEPGVARM